MHTARASAPSASNCLASWASSALVDAGPAWAWAQWHACTFSQCEIHTSGQSYTGGPAQWRLLSIEVHAPEWRGGMVWYGVCLFIHCYKAAIYAQIQRRRMPNSAIVIQHGCASAEDESSIKTACGGDVAGRGTHLRASAQKSGCTCPANQGHTAACMGHRLSQAVDWHAASVTCAACSAIRVQTRNAGLAGLQDCNRSSKASMPAGRQE
jgi:hypothetical protein